VYGLVRTILHTLISSPISRSTSQIFIEVITAHDVILFASRWISTARAMADMF
jgi:hypothetical protein